MGVRNVMAEIVAIEAALSIDSPHHISGDAIRTHRMEAGREALTEQVTFMNLPDVGSELRMGTTREDHFSIQIDCYVKNADIDVASDVALAIFDACWAAFDAQRPAGQRLGGTVDYLTLRAERPTFETMDWAGQGYPGFHMFLDLVMFEESL